ncbi:MAG: hypothetical protein RSA84_19485 [Acinetobacter sp.]
MRESCCVQPSPKSIEVDVNEAERFRFANDFAIALCTAEELPLAISGQHARVAAIGW